MARTEYYDDPDAPKPNSLVVAASAVVTDDEGRILLQQPARQRSLGAAWRRHGNDRLATRNRRP